jgi:hypothetical protein
VSSAAAPRAGSLIEATRATTLRAADADDDDAVVMTMTTVAAAGALDLPD